MVEMYKHGENDGPEQEEVIKAAATKKKKAEAVRSSKKAQPKEEPGPPKRQLPEIQHDKTGSTTKNKKSQLASLNFALKNMVDMYQNGQNDQNKNTSGEPINIIVPSSQARSPAR